MSNDIKDSQNIEKNVVLVPFESITYSKGPSVIPEVTVIVTNVSRIIETKNGKYQIAGLMDHKGKPMSINLYGTNIGAFKVRSPLFLVWE